MSILGCGKSSSELCAKSHRDAPVSLHCDPDHNESRPTTVASYLQSSGGLHAQILYRCRDSGFGHGLLGKCSREQRRYASVTCFLCGSVWVIPADSRSRTGLVDGLQGGRRAQPTNVSAHQRTSLFMGDKNETPRTGKRPGRVQKWILLSAIRSNANSIAANCTKGCALDHTAMPLCVCAVIQITTNRA